MSPTASDRASARDAYHAEGFYGVQRPVLSAHLVARAVDGMDAVRAGQYDTGCEPYPSPWKPGDAPDVLCKIEMPHFANGALREVVSSPDLGLWAAAVTGAERAQVWWVQLLYKPPAPYGTAGAQVGWHQDFQYWQHDWEPGSEVFTAWLALSDVTADSGPMHFIRGSHRWGFRDEGDFFSQDLDGQRHALGVPEGATWEETAALLPPGGVSFHHGITYHGSGPNRSDAPRRSLAIHLCTERARLRPGARTALTSFLDDPATCPVIHGTVNERVAL